MNVNGTVLCIVGPTASGKTSLSINAAKLCNGEIVSADAVAVYRGLDIGSAKPTMQERQGIRHHLIDIAEITDTNFSVSRFRELARAAIEDILSRSKLPIVVGGSGLYADAIFADMRFSTPSDPLVRAEIESEYARDRNAVFERLTQLDPITAKRLHINDKKRVVRAMEVILLTERPFSELNAEFESAQQNDGTYRTVKVGITFPREILYQRIDERVDRMMQLGLKEEAYGLFDQGLRPDRYTAMHSIGYTQLYESYCGLCSVKEAVEKIKLATRHFAKRQLTWFKRDSRTIWFDASEIDQKQILQNITELI